MALLRGSSRAADQEVASSTRLSPGSEIDGQAEQQRHQADERQPPRVGYGRIQHVKARGAEYEWYERIERHAKRARPLGIELAQAKQRKPCQEKERPKDRCGGAQQTAETSVKLAEAAGGEADQQQRDQQ